MKELSLGILQVMIRKNIYSIFNGNPTLFKNDILNFLMLISLGLHWSEFISHCSI